MPSPTKQNINTTCHALPAKGAVVARTVTIALGACGQLILAMAQGVSALAIDSAVEDEMAARVKHLECRVNLAGDQIAALAQAPNATNLSSHAEKLDTDLDTLKELVDPEKRKAFRDYIHDTLRQDLKDAKTALKDGKQALKDLNISTDVRKEIKADFKAAREDFADCQSAAQTSLIEARIAHYEARSERWDRIVEKAKNESLNTTGLEAIVEQGRTELLPALEAAKAATDPAAREQALKETRSLHLHLWARFEIARVRMYLALVLGEDATKVDQVTDLLSQAETLAAPGRQYAPGEFDTVRTNIKEAAKLTKELLKAARASG